MWGIFSSISTQILFRFSGCSANKLDLGYSSAARFCGWMCRRMRFCWERENRLRSWGQTFVIPLGLLTEGSENVFCKDGLFGRMLWLGWYCFCLKGQHWVMVDQSQCRACWKTCRPTRFARNGQSLLSKMDVNVRRCVITMLKVFRKLGAEHLQTRGVRDRKLNEFRTGDWLQCWHTYTDETLGDNLLYSLQIIKGYGIVGRGETIDLLYCFTTLC